MYWTSLDNPYQIRFSNNHNFNKDIIFKNPDELKAHTKGNKIKIITNPSLKVAVISQTYYRKDGSSKKNLQKIFKMLEDQKYKNFKLFITGDNYKPNKEFEEVCNTYKRDIYKHNNNHSCRTLKLGWKSNYWACGGMYASFNSYKKAMEENYDIALLLDDDDHWFDFHIKTVVDNFIKFPHTGLLITLSKYTDSFLPCIGKKIKKICYNNYIPKFGDSVKAASAHNLRLIGNEYLATREKLIKLVNETHLSKKKEEIAPADGTFLKRIGELVKSGKVKSLYIPIMSVEKKSDCNWHNIMVVDGTAAEKKKVIIIGIILWLSMVRPRVRR